MTARRIMWPMTVILVLAVVALVVPGSPFYLTDLLASGWHFHGRSTAYWIRALETEDLEERNKAIFALGAIGARAEEAVPVLAALMTGSPDRNTRSQAALALSKMAPASRLAVPALAQALNDEEPWVRMNAVMALSRLKADARAATAALVQALNDKSNDTNLGRFNVSIQQMAVLTLGRVGAGNADALAALTAALGKEFSDRVRWSAVQALGEIGPEARPTVPLLRALLKHNSEELREAAAEALRQIEPAPAAGS